ncbi:MAG: NADPH-dependent FMN reductase [Magnetovibrionaceae bacterium]
MKILAFAASNSKQSINKALVRHAADVFTSEILSDATVDQLDLNDFEMPLYSIDRENEGGIPDLAKAFYGAIGEADALIISFAEHNGTYTAAFKNLFDWMSRIDRNLYQGKPLLALATSPGKGGAGNVLNVATSAAPHFGTEVVASLSVPSFYEVFDTESGTLTDPALAAALRQALSALCK